MVNFQFKQQKEKNEKNEKNNMLFSRIFYDEYVFVAVNDEVGSF